MALRQVALRRNFLRGFQIRSFVQPSQQSRLVGLYFAIAGHVSCKLSHLVFQHCYVVNAQVQLRAGSLASHLVAQARVLLGSRQHKVLGGFCIAVFYLYSIKEAL